MDRTSTSLAALSKSSPRWGSLKRFVASTQRRKAPNSSTENPFAPFPVKKASTSFDFTSEFEILRGDLAKVLYEATKDHGNIEYLFATTIEEVVANDESNVRVALSNGSVQDYDLLVAADGQWSNVHKQVFPRELITVADKGLYTVYWTIPRIPADNAWWNIYHAIGSRVVSTRPDPHGTTRAFIGKMPCNDAEKKRWQEASRSDRATQEDLIRREFADAGWQAQRILDAMGSAPDFYFQAVQQIKMSEWSSYRVVCLGDAAHAPTPLTGMGTSLAMIGGYVLAGELSKLEEGEHPMKALEAYEGALRPFVEKIQSIPSFVPGIAHPETASKIWLLHTLAAILSRAAAIPWLATWAGSSRKDNFTLPRYSGMVDDGEDYNQVATTSHK